MNKTLKDAFDKLDGSPLRVFLNVKFTVHKYPYAYALAVQQDGDIVAELGCKCLDFFRTIRNRTPPNDEEANADRVVLKSIREFRGVENTLELSRMLRGDLLDIERALLIRAVSTRSKHIGGPTIIGNDVTLVYARLLMVDMDGLFDFCSSDAIGKSLQETANKLKLRSVRLDPLSNVKALAYAYPRAA